MELKGKNAIVTGAAKRIGRAVALVLADKGVNIALHYNRSRAEAEELKKILSEKGVQSTLLQADLENPKEAVQLVEKARVFFGNLDLLINNAAVFYPTLLQEVTEKNWDQFMNINLKSQFFAAREFAKGNHGKPAKIINFSDSYSASPATDFIPYGVSKAGVVALTKGLAKAYAPDILVNAICPGPILPAESLDPHSQERAVNSTLLKRTGSVEDVVKAVIFLAENDSITGQAIFIDGGRN